MTDSKDIGTLEIHRPKGLEIWKLTSGNFSLDQHNDRYRLNFWVESSYEYVQKLEDTGDTPVAFEVVLPFEEKPNFDKPWKYEYPGYRKLVEDYGEDPEDFSDNFYYYEHDSLEDIVIEIEKLEGNLYTIRVEGKRDDPIDWKYGKAKYIIKAQLELTPVFSSYWT